MERGTATVGSGQRGGCVSAVTINLATLPKSGPMMSGFGPSGYKTFPGLATNAAAHAARSAPTTSYACAATSRN